MIADRVAAVTRLPRPWSRLAPRATGVAVPLYVHPVVDPAAWRDAALLAVGPGFVVVNAADGPGPGVEAAYTGAVAALAAAGVPLVGYVDAAYGARPPAEIADDVTRWHDRYGVDGVFVDRVPTGPRDVDPVLRLLGRLRRVGARRLVLNPGAVPPPQLVAGADVVVTFEGPWSAYTRLDVPDWLRSFPPARVCHLVHGVPSARPWSAVAHRAAALGAGVVGASRGSLPNPWTGLPAGAPRRDRAR